MKNSLLYPKESYLIRGACFELYKELGCGHKEVVYQRGLVEKLHQRTLHTDREFQIPVLVNGKKVGIYIPDILVNNHIILELKATSYLTQQAIQQFWQYLRNSPFRLGFLINFGKPGGVEIVRRVYDRSRDKVPRPSA